MNGLALCSGIGGIELGLRFVVPTYRTICYVERETYVAGILVSRMEDATMDQTPIWSDVKTFDGRPWGKVVDIVTAGYPCQPYSVAGRRMGESDSRNVWPDIRRIVGEVKPTFVFCENVSAHLSLGFEQIAKDMGKLGFKIAVGVFTAWAVGACHKRERLFWLATHADDQGLEGWNSGGLQECSNKRSSWKACSLSTEKRKRIGRWPIESALCGSDDDVPNRMDRLRALGNAVVPQVAARAFIVLLSELFNER